MCDLIWHFSICACAPHGRVSDICVLMCVRVRLKVWLFAYVCTCFEEFSRGDSVDVSPISLRLTECLTIDCLPLSLYIHLPLLLPTAEGTNWLHPRPPLSESLTVFQYFWKAFTCYFICVSSDPLTLSINTFSTSSKWCQNCVLFTPGIKMCPGHQIEIWLSFHLEKHTLPLVTITSFRNDIKDLIMLIINFWQCLSLSRLLFVCCGWFKY